MNIKDFLRHLEELDIRLWIENDSLEANLPAGMVDQSLVDSIKDRRDEIVAYLLSEGSKVGEPAATDGANPSTRSGAGKDASSPAEALQANPAQVRKVIREHLAEVLFVESARIDDSEPMVDLGLDSILLVEVVKRLNDSLGLNIKATKLYDYPTVTSLADYLASQLAPSASSEPSEPSQSATPAAASSAPSTRREVGSKRPAEGPPSAEIASAEPKGEPAQVEPATLDQVKQVIKAQLAAVLFIDSHRIDEEEPLVDLGLDSILLVELVKKLNETFELNLKATKFYDYPNVAQLGGYIASLLSGNAPPAEHGGTQAVAEKGAKSGTKAASATGTKSVALSGQAKSPAPKNPPVKDPAPAAGAGPVKSKGKLALKAKTADSSDISLPDPILPTGRGLVLKTPTESAAAAPQAAVPGAPNPVLSAARGSTAKARAKAPVAGPGDTICLGALIESVGDIADIALREVLVKAPGPGEIQIRVAASALNFPDILCVQGLYPTMPDYPFVPGFELAGVVAAVGAGVSRFKTGDPVIAITGDLLGGHAQRVNVDEHLAVLKPDGLDFGEASALPVVFLTAYYALYEVGRLKPGDHLLIQTAAGGVGLIAIQLAKLRGATIYGTSSSPEKRRYLREIGVHHAIDYRGEGFVDEVKALTKGRGVDLVLNTLSGDMIQKGLDILAPGGRYLEIAVAGLKASRKLALDKLVHNQSFHSIDLRKLIKADRAWPTPYLDTMVRLVGEGAIKANVLERFPAASIREGLAFIADRKSVGKVVLDFESTANLAAGIRSDEAQAGWPVAAVARDIAVIGMSGRFPGAADVDTFWANLREGVDSVSEVPAERWDANRYFDPDPRKPNKTYSKWGGFLEDYDKFDPAFFNLSPMEAELMDPQQRIFLQESWLSLEDAGYPKGSLSGVRCGVFAGVSRTDYGRRAMDENQGLNALSLIGNSNSILASRIAFILNLTGPCLAVDTACASSLTAVHLACRSLIEGESDMAIAGGVNLNIGPALHIMASKLEILSPSGKCRVLDAGADGWVIGEGAGCVVLKPLDAALRDGDPIHGVIKASGINQNGMGNGLVAPKAGAQTLLQREVYRKAGIAPDSIDYIETQGTGTLMGDRIELDGLRETFEPVTDRKGVVGLGSLKPNIGHPMAASGIAVLIKILLSLRASELPRTIHFEKENPDLDLKSSPFFVVDHNRPWPIRNDRPRRAAINSFGFSGTNCHLVIEEAPRRQRPEPIAKPYYLLPVTAKTEAGLNRQFERLATWLEGATALHPGDLAYTMMSARQAHPVRSALIFGDLEELRGQVRAIAAGRTAPPLKTDLKAHPEETRPALAALGRQFLTELAEGRETDGTLYREKLAALADLFTKGFALDWQSLYRGLGYRRISAPGYAFARERYWLAEPEAPAGFYQLPDEDYEPETIESGSPDPVEPLDLPVRLRAELIQLVAGLLKIGFEDVDINEDMSEMGFDSVIYIEFANRMSAAFNLDILPTVFYEHATLGSLASGLLAEYSDQLETHFRRGQQAIARRVSGPRKMGLRRPRPGTANQAIAIIGMAGRLPQSPDLETFWKHLESRRDLISEIPPDRWDWREYYGDPQGKENKTNVKWGGFLAGADLFDAAFFGISPREAVLMDPQQRLFLESVWQSMEDAGYAPGQLAGTQTGVFAGVGVNDYFDLLKESDIEGSAHVPTGNFASIMANRVSFLLDLHGPSEPVDTACSSSLVAIHRAVQALRQGDCDMAFAGGVNLMFNPKTFVSLSKAGMLSPTGRCRTFDKSADGYARGEGVGVVLLKPLDQAEADGDHIYAVIRGSAINHGGHANSLTAPNPNAQAAVLVAAYENAQIDPVSVTYVETHGTATNLGDPVEINGLKKAFDELYRRAGKPLPRKPHIALGAVKSNIGHLEIAAGISGLFKVVLAMKHGRLPGNVHISELNPYLRLENSPFYVPMETHDWPRIWDDSLGEIPRRAGLSSFGFGGVNAHVVIEEYVDQRPVPVADGQTRAIVLSARDEARLRVYAGEMARFLDQQPGIALPDLAHTLAVGRAPMEMRLAFVAASVTEATQKLATFAMGRRVEGLHLGDLNQDRVLEQGAGLEALEALRDPKNSHDWDQLARLWTMGVPVDWAALAPSGTFARRLSLPTYPFERRRFWFQATPRASRQSAQPVQPVQPAKSAQPVRLQTPASSVRLSPTIADSPQSAGRQAGSADAGNENALIEAIAVLRAMLAEVLYVAADELDERKPFADQGLDSILGVEFMRLLNQHFGLNERAGLLYEHTHLQSLAGYLAAKTSSSGSGRAAAPAASMRHEQQGAGAPMSSGEPPQAADWAGPREAVLALLAEVLYSDVESLNSRTPFAELGLDSILTVEFVRMLNRHFDLEEKASLLYEHTTPDGLIAYLASKTVPALGSGAAASHYADRDSDLDRVQNEPAESLDEDATRARIKGILAEVLYVDGDELSETKLFADLGLDSILSVEFVKALNDVMPLPIKAAVLYDHASIAALAAYLTKQMPPAKAPLRSIANPVPIVRRVPANTAGASPAQRTKPLLLKNRGGAAPASGADSRSDGKLTLKTKPALPESAPRIHSGASSIPSAATQQTAPPASRSTAATDIAVIGMSGRFAGAPDLASLWENLSQGRDAVTEVPPERWSVADYYNPDSRVPGKTACKWGGFLADIDKFDPSFFNIDPTDAKVMDPQQRLFLETAWHALEDAGYGAAALAGLKCGVFAGVSNNDYAKLVHTAHSGFNPAAGMLGNTNAILAARIAYHLDLKGPAMTIDAACSSSSVAIHLACKSLIEGDTDMMLAGGITLYINPDSFVVMSKAGMLSETGRCRPFDDNADGFVPGEGAGVVVLKRLDRALADGDRVLGVIKASAMNQNGRSNGLTAPSAEPIAALHRGLYEKFAVDPRAISYIEAHGTGTKIGDSMEVDAITRAFRQYTADTGFCGIGSIKSNLGHTTAAAGVAGLIKVLLALHYNLLPATINFSKPNEDIDFDQSPFFVNRDPRPWPEQTGAPRRALVCASAFSGTNTCLLVEEPPALARIAAPAQSAHLFPFSAESRGALQTRMAQFLDWFERHGAQADLGAIAFTLALGRTHHPLRRCLVAADGAELKRTLRQACGQNVPAPGAKADGKADSATRKARRERLAGLMNDLAQAHDPGRHRQTLTALAELYEQGMEVDWNRLGLRGRRLGLPLYPFERQSYWVPDSQLARPAAQKAALISHPMAALGWSEPGALTATVPSPGAAQIAQTGLAGLPQATANLDEETLFERGSSYLGALLAGVLGKSEAGPGLDGPGLDGPGLDGPGVDGPGLDQPFAEYGLDSFHTLKAMRVLEDRFGKLPKTLLFQKFTLNALTAYFLQEQRDRLLAKLDLSGPGTASVKKTGVYKATSKDGGTTAPEPVVAGPLIVRESRLDEDPELKARIAEIYAAHRMETSVAMSRFEIAPYLFIGTNRRAYFNFQIRDQLLLVWAYTGPAEEHANLTAELHRFCQDRELVPNLFGEERLTEISGEEYSATPISVMQRVTDLAAFDLKGNRMRRLRYMVSKIQKEGECRTEEYHSGANPETDRAVAEMVDRWCAARTQINPFIRRIRAEIAAGRLSGEHRMFLTYLDGKLQNAIIITSLSEGHGYLMDVEFYPEEMPLGGLEFAICQMIEKLAAEGCQVFSMGGTFGAQVEPSPNADPEIVHILENLRDHDAFGQGNFQFKNKFRPQNTSIYLCRPVSAEAGSVTDIMMMIADPHDLTTDEEARLLAPVRAAAATVNHVAHGVGAARFELLDHYGFNPVTIPHDRLEFDLMSDSWAYLEGPAVRNRLAELHEHEAEPVNLDTALKSIFPFEYLVPVASGRMAESFFFEVWPRRSGRIPQNLLFPTWIYHQLNSGFEPVEVPIAGVFDFSDPFLFKGNLDLDRLAALLEEGEVDMVAVEMADNAAGGYPVSLANLRAVRSLADRHGVPVVLDATRILENARLIAEHESQQRGRELWAVAADLMACADHLTASLTKDFSINVGGIIATRDAELFRNIQDAVAARGSGLGLADKKLIGLALTDRNHIKQGVYDRIAATRALWQTLRDGGIPVVEPCGAHCVLIDTHRIAALSGHGHPLQAFLAWLFLQTGVRAGVHSAGLQKQTALNRLIRLAVPVGLSRVEVEEIGARLVEAIKTAPTIPDLRLVAKDPGVFGEIMARFEPLGSYEAVSARQVNTLGAVGNGPATTTRRDRIARNAAKGEGHETEIAIIGISGRFPLAANLDEFWRNLTAGRDCVTPMPEPRLKLRRQPPNAPRPLGGFLDDIDKFDAPFFNIEAEEAIKMDPQERLFLETAWETLEDAGYLPEDLAGSDGNRAVGVFVGAVWGQYQMLGAEESLAGNPVNANSFHWSIANRVSSVMNFNGPSFSVDAACSSAMTAVHLACEAIRNGECRAALAGGVNLDLHPSKLAIMEADKVVSEDGKCHSFGDYATGYVAGEGVGAVLLKPLGDAVREGDHIYGVIKSSVINHDGRSSGYTVPNPNTQAALIAEAIRRAGVDPASIGYIEAHGTGTAMGDAIEVQALTAAFEETGWSHQMGQPARIPIGTAKANIGHLEPASGIAAIAKLLLQFRHRQLPPSLHADPPSPFIEFEETPFFVQTELTDWRPLVRAGREMPLRAGLSTFGAGGTNLHLILEAFPEVAESVPAEDLGPLVFVLSALDRERLTAYAARLKRFLDEGGTALNLADLAFTLQVGRRPLSARLALVATTKAELAGLLSAFLAGRTDHTRMFVGEAPGSRETNRDKENQLRLAALVENRDWSAIAALWATGVAVNWRGLYRGQPRRRVSLPTYPFARLAYWVAMTQLDSGTQHGRAQAFAAPLAEPASGDGKARPEGPLAPADAAIAPVDRERLVMAELKRMIAGLLHRSPADLEVDVRLDKLGFDSLTGMKLINRMRDVFGIKLSIMSFFEYDTIQSLHQYMKKQGLMDKLDLAKSAREMDPLNGSTDGADFLRTPSPQTNDPDPGGPADAETVPLAGDSSAAAKDVYRKILVKLAEGKITPSQAMALKRFARTGQEKEVVN